MRAHRGTKRTRHFNHASAQHKIATRNYEIYHEENDRAIFEGCRQFTFRELQGFYKSYTEAMNEADRYFIKAARK